MEAVIEREDMAELERKAITARIKQARLETGLSQPEMAEALHAHERTYQNYESQKAPRVPWGLMNEISTITGKSTEWLIHGDKPAPDLSTALNGSAPDVRRQLAAIEKKQEKILDLLDQFSGVAAFVKQDLQPALERLESELRTSRPDADTG